MISPPPAVTSFESPSFNVGRSQFIEYYLNIDAGLLVSKLLQSGDPDCLTVSIRGEKINIISVLGCPDYVIDCYWYVPRFFALSGMSWLFRDWAKFTVYLGRAFGENLSEKSLRPPFLLKKYFFRLIFSEKSLRSLFVEKSLRPLFRWKKSPPPFSLEKSIHPLSIVPAQVSHTFWPVP